MGKLDRGNSTHRETSREKSRFTATKSVECFTTTLEVKLPSWTGAGPARTPRKTKLVVPPLSCVSEEQAKGVAESSCEMVAASASFFDSSRGGIFALLEIQIEAAGTQLQVVLLLVSLSQTPRESYLGRGQR